MGWRGLEPRARRNPVHGPLGGATLAPMPIAALPILLAAGVSQFGIVNGSLEPGMEPVVALGASLGEYSFSACTATLITPEVLLTAAHCGNDYPLEAVIAFGAAFFGPDMDSIELEVGLSNLVVHPDYDPLENTPTGTHYGSHDISVITLEEPVTTITPALLRRNELTLEDEGRELVSVGFGITGPSADDGGIKRSATLLVDQLWQGFVLSRNAANPNEANICSGDSGGPMFEVTDGRLIEWAVHSWGDQGCAQRSGSTRVDMLYEWILDQVEDVHGSRDLCAINGFYGDGWCDVDCPEEDVDCLPPEEADDDDSAAEPIAEDPPGEDGGEGCSDCGSGGSVALVGLVLAPWRRRRA
jgi:hypothetical protein